MGLIEAVILTGLLWILAVVFVIALCWGASRGDRLMAEESSVETSRARRFRSAA